VDGARKAAPVTERVRILYIIDYFHRTGGTEKHLTQLVLGLPRERFACAVVAFDLGENPLLDEMRAAGIPVLAIPVGREYVPSALLRAADLSRVIRTLQPDIVQTFHQKADTFGALVARLSGARHLVSSKRDTGDLRRPWHVWMNRCLKSLFEAVIVVSERVRAAVIASNHLPDAKITTIYNGVDLAHFVVPDREQAAAAKARLGFAAEDFVVGCVAGFRPEKNHDVFFDGVARVATAIPSLRVLAVGGGPLLEHYRTQIARSELGPRTLFTGDLPDVVGALWAMDVGCLTPGGNEGFSNAVVEQMAVGLPMIVTDVGGNAEAVAHGVNGWVIPPNDAAALARALLELHADSERRAAMARASRTRAANRFSLERMCQEHARLYVSLLEPGRAPGNRPLGRD
jgi:glycosyltransferase involved in cell wall biosynthesis